MDTQKETILVTGTSGRLGYPVAQKLAASYNVVGFDRRAPSHPPPTAECLYVDLVSEESVRRGLQAILDLHGPHLASVIHLAAYYDFSGMPSPLYDEVTVQGTARLLELLQELGFQVDQFIFSSTELVHAPSRPGERITEDSPLRPAWPYPESKVKTERVIHMLRGNIPTVILRIGGVYDDLCDSIPLAQQIQRIYEQDITAYLFPGDLSAGRQAFVHLDDVVEAILLAVERRKELPPEAVFLIGEPESLSYGELQEAFGQLIHGVAWRTFSVPKSLAKVGAWLQEKLPLNRPPFIKPWMIDLADDNFEVDITRARTLLGWEPKHSLRETLPKMVLALKADPFAWYRENGLTRPLWLQELAPTEGLTDEMDPQELMRLEEEVQRAIGSDTEDVPHAAQEHRDMQAHGMVMSQPDEAETELRAREAELERLRALQARLERAYEREVAVQREEDALAHRLMESDPRRHVEVMKMKQKHRQLALELPRILLEYEAQVYQALQKAWQAASARWPDTSTMMANMVSMARWSQIPLLVLGAWLISSPFIMGYETPGLVWSDVISGVLVMVLALLAFRTGRALFAWGNAFVGLWLALSPLIFWTPSAAAYGNDTLVGMLIITFAVLIPMMMKMPGPEVPLGWSYNPSSWMQRAPILALAMVSFLMSRYMAAFQLGHISWAWDPVFARGTVQVLTSDVSKAFPISDAGLGAFTYLVELLSGFMGDARRWRTMPWMVALFGFMVVPLGIVSVVLITLQPVAVGAWCLWCLLSAFFMLIMVALSLDEVIAMLQYLLQARRAGKSVWRTFWLGGDALGDYLTPQRPTRPARLGEMFWGMRVPWNLLVVAGLGAWLMASPSIFGTGGMAAHVDHVLGALVVTVTIIAFAEVGRAARFLNIPLALGIAVLPWLVGGTTLASSINGLIAGALIVGLSIPPGNIKDTYDGWNPLIV